MMNKGSFYEQIEAFLTDRLSPDEQAAMQNALRDDPDLAREVELRRLEFDVAESLIAGSIRAQLQQLRTEPPDIPKKRPNRLAWWLIAAVLCITAIGVLWRPDQPSPSPAIDHQPVAPPPGAPDPTAPPTPVDTIPEPVATNPAPPRTYLASATELYKNPDFETYRRAAAGSNDPLDSALTAWQGRDYRKVLTAVQGIAASDPKYWQASSFRGHAQFKLKRYRDAVQTFTAIVDSGVQPWAEETEAYLLLALLADGKSATPEFQTLLKKILADPGHPGFETAQAVRKRL